MAVFRPPQGPRDIWTSSKAQPSEGMLAPHPQPLHTGLSVNTYSLSLQKDTRPSEKNRTIQSLKRQPDPAQLSRQTGLRTRPAEGSAPHGDEHAREGTTWEDRERTGQPFSPQHTRGDDASG